MSLRLYCVEKDNEKCTAWLWDNEEEKRDSHTKTGISYAVGEGYLTREEFEKTGWKVLSLL